MLIKKILSFLMSIIMLMTAGLTTNELTEKQIQAIAGNKYSQAGVACTFLTTAYYDCILKVE